MDENSTDTENGSKSTEANPSESTSGTDLDNNRPSGSGSTANFNAQEIITLLNPDGNSTSSSETNEERDPEYNSDDWVTTDEEPDFVPDVLKKTKPKSTLSITKEVMNRQIGHSNNFDKKLYGNVHMVERLKYCYSLEEHQGCVNTIEFNQKGNLLVSGSDDLAIIIWNWAMLKKLNSYESGHRDNIFQASWLPGEDPSLMVTCASDGQVRLLDLNKGTTRKLAAHRGACNKFAMHPVAPYLAMSVGNDGKVLSIDIRDAQTTKLMTMKERDLAIQLHTIHLNPSKVHEFCIGGHSDFVRVYDRRKADLPLFKLRPENVCTADRVHVSSAIYNYDGTEILASYNDDDIYLFDTFIPGKTNGFAHKYEGHRNSRTIKAVNYFGPRSEFIVSGSDCGHIYFWEKNSEAIVQCMPGDNQGVVNRIEPHPLVPILASSGLDHDIKIWVPSANGPTNLSHLKELVTTNVKDRATEGPFPLRPNADIFHCHVLDQVYRNSELFNRLLSGMALGNLFSQGEDDSEDDDDDDDL